MSRDTIAELLHQADADAPPPPPLTPGLAERILARRRVQLRRRRIAGAVALPVAAIALTAVLLPVRTIHHSHPSAQTTPALPSVDVAVLRAELARLDSVASLSLAIVNGVDARQRQRVHLKHARELLASALDPIRSERDKAALTMIDHGDRLRRDLKEPGAALAAYRRTIEMFPGTRWAGIATQRIEQLNAGARRIANDLSLARI